MSEQVEAFGEILRENAEGKMKKKCTCGHIACVCDVLEKHKPGCRYRRSVTCAVPIECEHGYDVCPTCDPCTCNVPAEVVAGQMGKVNV